MVLTCPGLRITLPPRSAASQGLWPAAMVTNVPAVPTGVGASRRWHHRLTGRRPDAGDGQLAGTASHPAPRQDSAPVAQRPGLRRTRLESVGPSPGRTREPARADPTRQTP